MTFSQQCVSLDIAQRMEELGVPQDSLFKWFISPDGWKIVSQEESTGKLICPSAFTVSELGEMLPIEYKKAIYHPKNPDYNNEYLHTFKISFSKSQQSEKPIIGEIYKGNVLSTVYSVFSFCTWREKRNEGKIFNAPTLADAMGKMYCHLLENNLIKI